MSDRPVDLALWIEGEIRRFIKSPENTMNDETGEPAWAEPLVGFSSGADPLYQFYKEDIGAFYLSPLEFFANEYPDAEATPDELTVISWILPQTEATKADHRRETYFPSERWARSRTFGEEVNNKLRRHIVEVLRQAGIEAVAPMLSPLWDRKTSERYGFASTWSERHAAYAAGLGTFGLSDGLITPKGKAIRAGSVVAHADIPPSDRPYTDHNAYCLFYAKGTCVECVDRCPIGAISEEGHDKMLCSRYGGMTRKYILRHFGFEGSGCGLCQTGVPCESGIPEGPNSY
ncbi:MAG: epoxyqueuosine reductase [Candidatus Bathyarchaeota archaeon]|nr:epoxyqueuosine reductase [Candidatus Bathyarchaeota archaeon]